MYWRQESFEGWKEVIELSKTRPAWKSYTAYCEAQAQGLRKRAFEHLSQFINELNQRPLQDRIEFVHWMEERKCRNDQVVGLAPYPLQRQVIVPTLEAWKKIEPHNPIPLRWINTKDSLLRAIELSDVEQIARYRLFKMIVGKIDMNQHELEKYLYLGDPRCDLKALRLLQQKIKGIEHAEYFNQEIEARITICETYLEFEKDTTFGCGNFIPFMRGKMPGFNFRKYL